MTPIDKQEQILKAAFELAHEHDTYDYEQWKALVLKQAGELAAPSLDMQQLIDCLEFAASELAISIGNGAEHPMFEKSYDALKKLINQLPEQPPSMNEVLEDNEKFISIVRSNADNNKTIFSNPHVKRLLGIIDSLSQPPVIDSQDK